jgi:hypothetical protein
MGTNKFTDQDKRRLMSHEAKKHGGKIPDRSIALAAQRLADKAHHKVVAKPAPKKQTSGN